MIRIPSAESCPPCPDTDSEAVEKALKAQLEDDYQLLKVILGESL